MGVDLYERVSPNLTHVVLRSHLIRTMEGLSGMKNLESLELYDNMVDELRDLDNGVKCDGKEGGVPGKNLKVLDISYNVIRDMGPVSLCPNLQELCELIVFISLLLSCSYLFEMFRFHFIPYIAVVYS